MPWKRVIKDFVIFQEMTKGIGKGQSQRQAAMHVAKKYPKLRLKADNAAAAVDRRFRRVKKQLEDGPELMAHFGAIVKRFLEQEAKARVEDPALSSEQQSEYATFLQVLQKMQGVDPLASLFQAYGHELRAALK